MIQKYIYNEKTYYSAYAVRQAIGEQENKAIVEPTTAEEWKKFNVTYIEEPTPLSELKEQKLQEIERKYLEYRNDTAVVQSSLGHIYDADRRAYLDVTGSAIDLQEGETKLFRDVNNEFHRLTKEQLNTLAKEIRANTEKAYKVKWTYQQQVNQAKSEEDINSINISFDTDSLLSTLSNFPKSSILDISLPRI